MCLLITGKASEIRATLLNTAHLLEDIFKSNEDGVGAMYATSKRVLRMPKALPKNVAEARKFIESLPNDDRSLALHWRMRTHGNTDLENCHPYPVVDGIAMMHNGVLSQGNAADKTKSDTWHYARDVLQPQLSEYPGLFMNKAWMQLVEADIGYGNRFAIMDADGNLAVLNKHTGIMVGDLWFSNTYAWDPVLLIPDYRKYTKPAKKGIGTYGAYGKHWSDTDFGDDEAEDQVGKFWQGALADIPGTSQIADELWAAINDADIGAITDILLDTPVSAFVAMFDECEFDPYNQPMAQDDDEISKLLCDQAIMPLANRCRTMSSATCVAQVMAWYGDWVGKPANLQGTVTDDTVKLAEQIDACIRDGDEATVDKVFATAEHFGITTLGETVNAAGAVAAQADGNVELREEIENENYVG